MKYVLVALSIVFCATLYGDPKLDKEVAARIALEEDNEKLEKKQEALKKEVDKLKAEREKVGKEICKQQAAKGRKGYGCP